MTDKSNIPDAWVVVGSTGTGKSSFVNLFSSKRAQVSDSHKSCTKNISSYVSRFNNKNGEKFVLIDTIGNEDSDGIKDEEIFTSILRFIHKHGLNSIIVFWLFDPKNRQTSTLQEQAKFINSFRHIQIWNSTIIIVKGATPLMIKKKSVGACEAILNVIKSNSGGDSKNDDSDTIDTSKIHKIGYKCIDWLDEDEIEEINDDYDADKQKEKNILNEDGVRKLIVNAVNDIDSCQVIFLNDKCLKCGEIGDRRILSPKCHFGSKPRKIHPKLNEFMHLDNTIYYKHSVNKPMLKHKNETLITRHEHTGTLEQEEIKEIKFYHDGELEKYHNGYDKAWHCGNIEKYHDGKYVSYHSSKQIPFHPGNTVQSHSGKKYRSHRGQYNVKYHPGSVERYHPKPYDSQAGSRVLTGILTLGITEIARRGYWICCDGRKEDAGCQQKWDCCNVDTLRKSDGCKFQWSCCGARDQNAVGCIEKWQCCDESATSSGCIRAWNCCKQQIIDENSKGAPCAIKYLCCNSSSKDRNKQKFNNGCKKHWTCCKNEDKNSKGCQNRWNCCKSAVLTNSKFSPNGCQQKCSNCDRLWIDNKNGCDTRYTCCKGSSKHNGCQNTEVLTKGDFLFTCCKGNRKSKGCYSEQFYQCCNKLAGADGCGVFYPCCNKFKFKEDVNNGCIGYYKCCNSNISGGDMVDGCVLQCCHEKRLNARKHSGCTEVCRKCGGLWNNPCSKGCGIGDDYRHDIIPLENNENSGNDEKKQCNQDEEENVQYDTFGLFDRNDELYLKTSFGHYVSLDTANGNNSCTVNYTQDKPKATLFKSKVNKDSSVVLTGTNGGTFFGKVYPSVRKNGNIKFRTSKGVIVTREDNNGNWSSSVAVGTSNSNDDEFTIHYKS